MKMNDYIRSIKLPKINYDAFRLLFAPKETSADIRLAIHTERVLKAIENDTLDSKASSGITA